MSLLITIFLVITAASTLEPPPGAAATETTFVFGGCSQLKYTPGSPYESAVNSILTSLVNSAMFTTYNNFTLPTNSLPTTGSTSASRGGGGGGTTVSGVFQCRGDLGSDACARCVARAVSQLGSLCLDALGGAMQLEGCFVRYDNATFLGVEDKTVVVNKCGPPSSSSSSSSYGGGGGGSDAVLDYMLSGGGGGSFRVGGSGNVQGVAQCVGDLSPSECQDCLSEAIQRLRTGCGPASWGDVYLAKCYARFSDGGFHSHGADGRKDNHNNDDEIEKTLAILIGLIAGVALLIVFLSFLRKLCESGGKGGK